MRAVSDEMVLTLSAASTADDVAARISALLKAGLSVFCQPGHVGDAFCRRTRPGSGSPKALVCPAHASPTWTSSTAASLRASRHPDPTSSKSCCSPLRDGSARRQHLRRSGVTDSLALRLWRAPLCWLTASRRGSAMGHEYASRPSRLNGSNAARSRRSDLCATARHCPPASGDALHSFPAAFRSSWCLTGGWESRAG